MPRDQLAVVRSWLEARARGDLDQAARLMSDDVRWHSPVEGEQRGRSAAREQLEAAERDTLAFESAVRSVRPLPDGRVVAVVRNVGLRDGSALDSEQALVFTVSDGAIAEVRIHVDDLEEVRAFWDGER